MIDENDCDVCCPKGFGRTVDQVDTVREMQETWRSVQGLIDEEQFVKTALREVDAAVALARRDLENIYYRNAVRLYPRVKGTMRKLGYEV